MNVITRFLAILLLVGMGTIQTAQACESFDTGCLPRDTAEYFYHTGDTGDDGVVLHSAGKNRTMVALGAGCATSPMAVPLLASSAMWFVVLLPLLGLRRKP